MTSLDLSAVGDEVIGYGVTGDFTSEAAGIELVVEVHMDFAVVQIGNAITALEFYSAREELTGAEPFTPEEIDRYVALAADRLDGKIETDAPVAEMTIGQLNAIGSAKSYLDFSAFSKSGLIDQLIYEGYSKTDAAFAVSNITVDWNEQAAKSAQSYLDFSSFSRQGLIDQLLYEGFTTGQAASGVAAVGF
ncbi:Ltp family lipoprotein [Ilumatobacter sp.]|uniref:Ltp family lipoprotein n=2 Tax=Ilumatobacter sp. TaxID=1967498 RepID=UPI003751F000